MRSIKGCIAAAKQNNDVIMTTNSHVYFDYYQSAPEEEPLAIGGHTTVENVYSFDPTSKELSDKDARKIIGAQGNLWTEHISTPEHVEYMILPRMSALAGVVWTPFEKKLERFFKQT